MKQAIRYGTLLGLTAVALALLAGCGGGGGSTPGTPVAITTIYAGHWAGNWSDASGEAGILDVTVGTDGRYSGVVMNVTEGGIQGSATGRVTGDGHLTGVYRYSGGVSVVVSGTVAVDQSGKLAGNIQESMDGRAFSSGGFILTRQ